MIYFLMGEEVAQYNGAYKAVKECLKNLERTELLIPISEGGFAGLGLVLLWLECDR